MHSSRGFAAPAPAPQVASTNSMVHAVDLAEQRAQSRPQFSFGQVALLPGTLCCNSRGTALRSDSMVAMLRRDSTVNVCTLGRQGGRLHATQEAPRRGHEAAMRPLRLGTCSADGCALVGRAQDGLTVQQPVLTNPSDGVTHGGNQFKVNEQGVILGNVGTGGSVDVRTPFLVAHDSTLCTCPCARL